MWLSYCFWRPCRSKISMLNYPVLCSLTASVLQIRKMLDLLVHASQGRSPQCQYPNCCKVKKVFPPFYYNARRTLLEVAFGVKQMWFLLQIHSSARKESECIVPRCRFLSYSCTLCNILSCGSMILIPFRISPGIWKSNQVDCSYNLIPEGGQQSWRWCDDNGQLRLQGWLDKEK